MVLINGIKYSCATCIKGHRASSCQHKDRPLIELKKKGRPPTQCAHCRELRKTKKLHIKCICAERAQKGKAAHPGCSPVNGKRDSNGFKVQDLLNPCDCSKSSHCQCCELICDTPSTKFCRQNIKTESSKNEIVANCCAPIKSNTIILNENIDETQVKASLDIPNMSQVPLVTDSNQSKVTSDITSCCDNSYNSKFAKSENRKIQRPGYCACGCKITVPTDSKLSLDSILNPCNCCSNGKICICCRSPDDIKDIDLQKINDYCNVNKARFSSNKINTIAKSEGCCSEKSKINLFIENKAVNSSTGGCCKSQDKPILIQNSLENRESNTECCKPDNSKSVENLIPKISNISTNPSLSYPASLPDPAPFSQVEQLYQSVLPPTSCCLPENKIDLKSKEVSIKITNSCTNCELECKCSSIKGGCCKPQRNSDSVIIEGDGKKSCGCGCYQDKENCSDCVKDSCAEFIFGGDSI